MKSIITNIPSKIKSMEKTILAKQSMMRNLFQWEKSKVLKEIDKIKQDIKKLKKKSKESVKNV